MLYPCFRVVSVAFLLLASPGWAADPVARVGLVLDAFHEAAADAAEGRYLELLSENFVFLGTDASERWQGQQWRDFVGEHFPDGRGWSYRPLERHVDVAPDGGSAWFDEILENEYLGVCRGSGVLLLTEQGWKISQYNLSIPIPNPMAVDVAQAIATFSETGESELKNPANVSDDESTGGVEVPVQAEEFSEPVEQPEEPETKKRCAKRHKTNRRADC